MDVLCTDKTGTITQGKIILEKHLDVNGASSDRVLHYGYLNSYHHTGLNNIMDVAILDHGDLEVSLKANMKYKKIDEIPFDFVRRRMSVILETDTGMHILICKGAIEETMACCTRIEINGQEKPLLPEYTEKAKGLVNGLNGEGFRVIAVAYKEMPGSPDAPLYKVADESGLVLLGFLAFLDPPKESAQVALKRLHDLNVDVKILTGDSEIVTAYICEKVGLPIGNIILGSQIAAMNEEELKKQPAFLPNSRRIKKNKLSARCKVMDTL
jgi:Mg2+-importing ATPase